MKMTLNKRDFKDEEYFEDMVNDLGAPEGLQTLVEEIDVEIKLNTTRYIQLQEWDVREKDQTH